LTVANFKDMFIKKVFILTGLLISISIVSLGQNFNSATRIKTFIKVWGFLKYYHPLIANGNIDWDSVFINNVQGIIDAKKPNEFNDKILDVINSVGKAPRSKHQKIPDSLFLKNKVNISWIKTSKIFNDGVKKQLQYVYDNKNQDSNRYIKSVYNTADFTGEKKYDSMRFPDVKHRLLFLCIPPSNHILAANLRAYSFAE
jgi:hypothetical protein